MSDTQKANLQTAAIKLCVIQLGRLGDTLQSLMALRAAKQLYPTLQIHFICRETFSSAAKRVPWLDQVTTFPTGTILGGVLEGAKSEVEAMADLARWIAPLVNAPSDILVNWTFSESSSWLAALIPSKVKLGFSRRRDGALSCADGWSHYIQAVVQNRHDQNIHITDILTTQLLTALQIHYGEPSQESNAPVTSKSFFNLELRDGEGSYWRIKDPARKWIGIQIGAGNPLRSWTAERWAAVASLILQRHPECRILLLGSDKDRGLAADFMSAIQGKIPDPRAITSMVGQSGFDLWASAVSRCQWVLAADTAVVHLASVLGTRVLNVAVGPSRWSETGPYGNGHYIVAPAQACSGCSGRSEDRREHSCHTDVTAEAVYAAWSYASTEWAHRRQLGIENHFSQLGWSSELANVRVLRSKIRGTDDGGGVAYEPMIQRALRINDWSAQAMGHIARAWYCGWTPAVGQELDRSMISPTLVQSLRQLSESVEVLAKICEEAKRTAGSLHQKGSKLRSVNLMPVQERQEIQDLGKKLLDLDGLLSRLGNAQETLAPFAEMSRVLMHNLQGDGLPALSRETAECYQQLSQASAILNQWIKKTLGLVRPMAIVSRKEAQA